MWKPIHGAGQPFLTVSGLFKEPLWNETWNYRRYTSFQVWGHLLYLVSLWLMLWVLQMVEGPLNSPAWELPRLCERLKGYHWISYQGAQHYAINKRVVFKLMFKVRQWEWNDSEWFPTPRSWKVIFRNPGGKVCICVDLTKLNETYWHVLQQSTMYSRGRTLLQAGCNLCFWQIPWPLERRRFTTFLTSFGRICFVSL